MVVEIVLTIVIEKLQFDKNYSIIHQVFLPKLPSKRGFIMFFEYFHLIF